MWKITLDLNCCSVTLCSEYHHCPSGQVFHSSKCMFSFQNHHLHLYVHYMYSRFILQSLQKFICQGIQPYTVWVNCSCKLLMVQGTNLIFIILFHQLDKQTRSNAENGIKMHQNIVLFTHHQKQEN